MWRLQDRRTSGGESAPAVLVVADDDALRAHLREDLRDAARVDEARDADEALARFRNTRPDVILIDSALGRGAGFSVCAALRSLPEGAHVPILMIMPGDDVAGITRAYDHGATDFVTTPLNRALLSHRVRYVIRSKLASDDLRAREQRFRIAERLSRVGHWSKDIASDALHCSEQIGTILGLTPEHVPRTLSGLLEFVAPEQQKAIGTLFGAVVRERRGFRVEHQILRKDGVRVTVSHEVECVQDETQQPVGLVGTIQDITERRAAEQRIHELAYIDSVTDLPNRVYLKEHLNHVIASPRGAGPRVAVLFIDLDGFKHVNDSMGHGVGDELLRRVARRLIANTRSSDGIVRWQPPRLGRDVDPATQLVTRIGGDEFVVVQEGIRSLDDALALGKRISGLLVKPFILSGRATHMTASIGISVFPDHGQDVESLLKNADAAMYHAKASGRAEVQIFDESINRRALARLHVENDLRKAVENKEFLLQYQPRVDLRSGQLVGVEALVRWRHPAKGLIFPKDFILISEEIGVIESLGQLVLEQACNQARIWRQQGHSFFVSVNLSAHQLGRPDLAAEISHSVNRAGLAANALELEITESAMMKDVDASAAVVAELRRLGFSLSVDDFGTGYSSLQRLKKLPVTALKLDRGFVSDMTVDEDSDAIVRTLISLGRSLGLRTVAEGVETEEQIVRLQNYGCDEAQGFYVSKALSPDKLREWIAAWKGLPVPSGSGR